MADHNTLDGASGDQDSSSQISSKSSLNVPSSGLSQKDAPTSGSSQSGAPAGNSTSGASPAREIQKSASPVPSKGSPNRTVSPSKDDGGVGTDAKKTASHGKNDNSEASADNTEVSAAVETTAEGNGASGEKKDEQKSSETAQVNGETPKSDNEMDTTDASASGPPAVGRDNTMQVTAKEGTALLKNEQLEGTRGTKNTKKAPAAPRAAKESKEKETKEKKPAVKRDSTITSAAKEAAEIVGADVGNMPRLRSAAKKVEAPPKPTRDNTMKRTAKEGKAMLDKKPPAKRARK